jgi:hypothetical protein
MSVCKHPCHALNSEGQSASFRISPQGEVAEAPIALASCGNAIIAPTQLRWSVRRLRNSGPWTSSSRARRRQLLPPVQPLGTKRAVAVVNF